MATDTELRLSPVTPDSFNAPREDYIHFGPRGVYTLAPTRDQAALTMEKCVQAHIAGMAKNSSFDCLRVKMHLREVLIILVPFTTIPLVQTAGLQLRYFCGISLACKMHDKTNLEKAKANIRDHFVTVMIVEQMLLSFRVLEHAMPSIFGGLAESYLNPSGGGTEIRSRMNRATVNEKAALKPPIRAFLQTTGTPGANAWRCG